MHKILVIRIYFLLDSYSVMWLQPHNSQTYGTGIYQMRCTSYKIAPDDGLIQSETCTASNGK